MPKAGVSETTVSLGTDVGLLDGRAHAAAVKCVVSAEIIRVLCIYISIYRIDYIALKLKKKLL